MSSGQKVIDFGEQLFEGMKMISSGKRGNVFVSHGVGECAHCTACRFEMVFGDIDLVKELVNRDIQLTSSLIKGRLIHELVLRG